MLKHTLYKVIQRKTYTCLSHKFGILFAYGGLTIILYSMFHFGEEVLEWSRYQYEVAFTVYHDNINLQSFQQKVCAELPIDAVYTWVNGSDPAFLADLKRYKQSYDINSSSGSLESSCEFSDCFQVPLVIVSPRIHENFVDDIMHRHKIHSKTEIFMEASFSTFWFDSVNNARNFTHHFNNKNYTSSLVYVSTDQSASHFAHVPHSLLLQSLPSEIKTNSDLTRILPDSLRPNLRWLYVNVQHQAAFLHFKDDISVKTLLQDKSNTTEVNGFSIGNTRVTLHLAYVINASNIYDLKEDASKSRFEDNEELRYSLRSVEKYAPWIRHIYIVTNGQIPFWMNMDSPHLTLVTHEEIFVNKSHLPTFSSPAIEAHIHRIPGLSQNFIYFNDDVMFGKEVWPEDFYSQAFGHKVYLTWPVPNCAEGCSPSWITDGYCDAACNVSECNWDGGDCTGDSIRPGVGMSNNFGGNQWQNSFLNYCKSGCSNSWLADRFCDQACNVMECGYDLGDCGLSNYEKLFLFFPFANGTIHTLPPGRHVGYFKLDKIFSKVTKAETEKNECIRSVAVSNKFHVLTIIFDEKCNETKVQLYIAGFPAEQQNSTEENLFKFHVEAFPSRNESTAVHSEKSEILSTIDSTTSQDDKIPEVIILNVPEDMKRPSLLTQKNSTLAFQLLSIQQLDFAYISPFVHQRIRNIEKEYQDGYLTSDGHQHELHKVLQPLQGNGSIAERIVDGNEVRKSNHVPQNDNQIQIPNQHDLDGKFKTISKQKVQRLTQKNETVNLRKLSAFEGRGHLSSEEFLNDNVALRFKTSFEKRKLLDTFGDSLRFVSKLYNQRFGFTQRKVPAHMPHMINVQIMEDLQSKYPHEYDMTSSHRFRHPQDMQFAFSYFYFVMSEEKAVNYSEIFNMFDTDGSAVLSDREIRLMATKIFPLPLTLQELTSIEQSLKECAIMLYGTDKNVTGKSNYQQPLDGVEESAATESYFDKEMPLVTKHLVLNCPHIVEMINKTFSALKKYKYEEYDQSEIAFKMIRNNISTVVGQLDEIRKNPKKFICLNDNIDHTAEASSTIRAVLHDFYETLFPHQSQFELAYEYRNRFNNIAELRAWKRSHQRTLWMLQSLLIFLLACILFSSYWDKLSRLWRNYKYTWKRKSIAKYFYSIRPANPV